MVKWDFFADISLYKSWLYWCFTSNFRFSPFSLKDRAGRDRAGLQDSWFTSSDSEKALTVFLLFMLFKINVTSDRRGFGWRWGGQSADQIWRLREGKWNLFQKGEAETSRTSLWKIPQNQMICTVLLLLIHFGSLHTLLNFTFVQKRDKNALQRLKYHRLLLMRS